MLKKFCFFLCLLYLSFAFASCGRGGLFLECLDKDFVCQIEGKIGDTSFCATLYGNGRIVYSAPKELVGILACEDGKTIQVEGVAFDGKALHGFFVPARLLCDSFETIGSGTQTQEGGLCYVDGSSPNGNRRVFVAKDGTPCRVSGNVFGISADFSVTNFQNTT